MWSTYKPHYFALSVIVFAACLRDVSLSQNERVFSSDARFRTIRTDFFESKHRTIGCLNFYFLMLYTIFTKVIKSLFGELRSSERQALKERLVNYTLFKIVFCSAVLEPDQIEFGILILWYGMFGFFRMIGKVARDRGESTSLLSLFVLISSNVLWFRIAYDAMSPRSVSESLLVMFESALNMIDLIHVTLFILLHYKEMYLHGGHWEMRRSWNYHVNVFADFFWDSFNLLHCIHVWILKGFSFTLVDAILLLSLKGVCSDLWVQYQDFSRYRETMNGFHVVLRDVTKSDLEKLAKEPCSICLSKLTRTVKCLPCGHFFHRVCIRNWLESKNSNRKCPVCRKSVFEDDDDKHRTSVVTTLTNDDVNNDDDTIDTSSVDNTRRVVSPSSPRPRRQRRLFDVNFMDFHLSLSQEENDGDNNVE